MNGMMGSILAIMEVADHLGVASYSNLSLTAFGVPALVQRNRSSYSYREAKNLLQFQAMLLVPHQVELMFVLCTLLSGRWKIEVQNRLATLGLVESLYDMYDRLSWGAESVVPAREHIHGPCCECSPESAMRVQYLRLVHNFYDRDFVDNPNKGLLLSSTEALLIREQPEKLLLGKVAVPLSERGLLSRISATLMNEPSDSVYRFWLASCLESFLRGSNQDHQVFVAHSGIVQHIVAHVLSIGVKSSNNLQTAFDLLGELIKFNRHTLELLESSFDDEQFRDFMACAMSNLIDSNVFLRSLFLSMESISIQHSAAQTEAGTEMEIETKTETETETENVVASHVTSYLTHSWISANPVVVSTRAIDGIGRQRLTRQQVSVMLYLYY